MTIYSCINILHNFSWRQINVYLLLLLLLKKLRWPYFKSGKQVLILYTRHGNTNSDSVKTIFTKFDGHTFQKKKKTIFRFSHGFLNVIKISFKFSEFRVFNPNQIYIVPFGTLFLELFLNTDALTLIRMACFPPVFQFILHGIKSYMPFEAPPPSPLPHNGGIVII